MDVQRFAATKIHKIDTNPMDVQGFYGHGVVGRHEDSQNRRATRGFTKSEAATRIHKINTNPLDFQ